MALPLGDERSSLTPSGGITDTGHHRQFGRDHSRDERLISPARPSPKELLPRRPFALGTETGVTGRDLLQLGTVNGSHGEEPATAPAATAAPNPVPGPPPDRGVPTQAAAEIVQPPQPVVVTRPPPPGGDGAAAARGGGGAGPLGPDGADVYRPAALTQRPYRGRGPH